MNKRNRLVAAALAATLVLGACDDGTDDDIDGGVDDGGVTETTLAPVPDTSLAPTTSLGG